MYQVFFWLIVQYFRILKHQSVQILRLFPMSLTLLQFGLEHLSRYLLIPLSYPLWQLSWLFRDLFRWRHQLAVGQFAEGGGQEIAVIRTPHLAGVIEIFAVEGNKLLVQEVLNGYSSHQIGWRNLDSAVAGDFDGNGQVEIIVPDQSQTALAGIEWVEAGLNIAWEAPLGGRLSTNIAAVKLRGGRLALGVGHDQNLLRVWLPQ